MIKPSFRGVGKPQKEKFTDISKLDGGLNTWELNYRIKPNQSPDMENLYWVDGVLSTRKGQEYLLESVLDGEVFAIYRRPFNGKMVAHAGAHIYTIDLETGAAVSRYAAVPEYRGSFFVFGDKLYYKTYGAYLVITDAFAVSPTVGYLPVTVINRKPDGTSGDLYQPENRIQSGKEVWFTADGTSTIYYLPYQNLDATTVTCTVNGVAKVETTDFTVDRTLGKITFSVAPAKLTPEVPNGVKVKCYKTDADTINSIMTCRAAYVYGGDSDLCVVVGGPTKQPNAYFWSGSHAYLDPTYFPFDYYNLAGSNADDFITGFGKQQDMLVIITENSVGKSYIEIETISGRDYVSMPYYNVNDSVGCDLPWSIQLIRNNIVFANTKSGVHIISDTTAAGENTVTSFSRNINGTPARPGLLYDVRQVAAGAVTSVNDGERYWICANGHAYLWDYTISPLRGSEEDQVWFYFTNINARSWMQNLDDLYYGTQTGQIVHFVEEYADFDLPITQRYQFAVQDFGTYEVLKDVTKVVFTVRSDTNTTIDITYETDYESRRDLTPIGAYGYKLSPRNLTLRILSSIRYAYVAVRKPGCRHVRHFTMVLENNRVYSGMSVVGAQIFYKFSGGDR